VTAAKLATLERRVAGTDIAELGNRVVIAAGVAVVVTIAGLPVVAGAVLAVVAVPAAVRYVRRELAVGALIVLGERRAVDLRVARAGRP
jgi:hypothetical protein